MITGRTHDTVMLNSGYVIIFVRRHAEVADPLRINRVHVKLLFLFLFIGNEWHAYFVWTPFRKLVGFGHREREILIIILLELVLYDVDEVEFLNVFLVEVACVEVVVAEDDAVWLVLEENIERIMQLILPVLTKLWRL